MAINADQSVVIVGAGLCGSLMALYLADRGMKVQMYEKLPDMRRSEVPAGRSINLALSERGLHALRQVGLADKVLKEMAIPMPGRIIHGPDGALDYQPYSVNPDNVNYSVSRPGLNALLMTEAENRGVHVKFRTACTNIVVSSGALELRDDLMQTSSVVTGHQTVLGCDGAGSPCRLSLQRGTRLFNYSQQWLGHGYKELCMPAKPGGGWLMSKNGLHIWPRGEYMMIALPNMDGSFTCTLFMPHRDSEYSFDRLTSPDKVTAFFAQKFPDALPLMPTLVTDFFANPIGDLGTVRCHPWMAGGKCCLMGDAAHAIVPFFGQGMNASFEDCTILDECMRHYRTTSWEAVFRAFQERRAKDTNFIADMAVDNYVEMRDRVADEEWKILKKIEQKLEVEFPGRYLSRYEMVCFTRIPYAEAYRRADINITILQDLAKGISTVEEVDLVMADRLIKERLDELKARL